jgi:hypothetical protein
MENKIYVLSQRDTKKSPAQCCVIEFEDVISEYLNAELIKPGYVVDKAQERRVLFVVGLSIYDIGKSLISIKTESFDQICAYVFDAFALTFEFKKPNWRKTLSSHYRTIKKINHLFVPFSRSARDFERVYQIPVHYMPMGVDAKKYGGYDERKIIDVNGYGRQYGPLDKILSERFNQPDSNRIYHHTSHQHTSVIHDVYAHRRLFWQQLRKSRIALAFDPLYADLNNRFPFSFVGQRWFESAAAGCVIVGKRPICDDMYDLFDWPSATIDLPDNASDMADFIDNLLNDPKLEEIGRNNSKQCLSRHDWRLRLDDMISCLY